MVSVGVGFGEFLAGKLAGFKPPPPYLRPCNAVSHSLKKVVFWVNFSLIFYVELSMKTRLFQAIYRWRISGDINKLCFEVLDKYYDHFWPCQMFIFIFIYFSQNWKIICSGGYWLKLIKFQESYASIGVPVNILEWGWPRIRSLLFPNLWEGVQRG